MSGGKHTAGPWAATTRRGSWDWVVYSAANPNIEICQPFHDGTEFNEIGEANARLIAAAPDLFDCAKLAEQIAHRSRSITAPEDAEIERLCERLGYGAVMDAAARLWVRKDPIGALTVGPCVATVQSAIAKAEGRAS